MTSPTTRFTDRVARYVKYRPSYPPQVIDMLRSELKLDEGSVIADVGAGTGIFTELLIDNGYEVYAVEPNDAMRQALELSLGKHAAFHSIAATAEATSLKAHSVDAITVAQAFHWFDRPNARTEFQRILKRGGPVILIWNERLEEIDAFHHDYEQLIQEFGTDYLTIKHNQARQDDVLRAFFANGAYRERHFNYTQDFDFEGLSGRLLSSSYIPQEGHPRHEAMMAALMRLYAQCQRADRISIHYDTTVYVGPVHTT